MESTVLLCFGSVPTLPTASIPRPSDAYGRRSTASKAVRVSIAPGLAAFGAYRVPHEVQTATPSVRQTLNRSSMAGTQRDAEANWDAAQTHRQGLTTGAGARANGLAHSVIR